MRKVLLLSVLLFLVLNNDIYSQIDTYQIIHTNNISLSFDHKGVFGSTADHGGLFKGEPFLFAAGFYLSGNYMQKPFANGSFSASRIEDYKPGKITNDSLSKFIYTVLSSDPAFSDSWHSWKKAVEYGASFYDGDNDGIYNPIDLNFNGFWDINEDKPAIIGDMTSWCVFNDGVESPLRQFAEQKPIGIEIYQTTFAFNKQDSFLDNYIFINYSIINKTEYVCDSVVFSPIVDFDLGNPMDDLIGSLDNYNSVFSYQKTTDAVFGSNVPTSFLSLILGPMTSIPNVSYIDRNNNNAYDSEFDSALTIGYKLSNNFSLSSYPGYININNNSSSLYYHSNQNYQEPNYTYEARNYSFGLNKIGNITSPCENSVLYTVLGNNGCETINPYFFFTGDPFDHNGDGWLNTQPSDYRCQANSGLFSLEPNKPVEILVAYHIGEGSNTEEGYRKGKTDLDSLFNQLGVVKYFPTSIQDNNSIEINNYELYNCYPNPFNPSTTIRYSVPQDNQVVIKVFDVLGNEVSTLLNDFVNKGTYEVKFDASNLASGMYFYTLKSGNFTSTKKMILIK